jgi:hypothetical protein
MVEPATGDAASPEAAGRAEAEDFERQLREIEASDREAILAGARSGEKSRSTDYQPAVDVARLRTRMEELVAFRNAVQESLVWRAAQALRRLIGRAW